MVGHRLAEHVDEVRVEGDGGRFALFGERDGGKLTRQSLGHAGGKDNGFEQRVGGETVCAMHTG